MVRRFSDIHLVAFQNSLSHPGEAVLRKMYVQLHKNTQLTLVELSCGLSLSHSKLHVFPSQYSQTLF